MEILIAILYCFHQVFGNIPFGSKILNSNLDFFYILGVIGVIFVIFKRKEDISRLILYSFPIVVYGIFQCLIFNNLNSSKLIVNIFKITICISLMILVSRKSSDFKIEKFVDYVCRFYIIFTPIAFILSSNTYFWRLNDTVNKYNTIRLNLFYIEPSELGFHLSIIIIILIYLIIKEKVIKIRVKYLVYMMDCFILLSLAKAYGSSVILLASIMIISFGIILAKMKYKNILVGYGLIFLFSLVIIFSVVTKSSMYMRTVDTLNGTDSSNRYRVGVTQAFTSTALNSTNGIGIGLGNLNTDETKNIFKSTGMTDVVAASFPYFIAEGGIFAALYIVMLMLLILKKVIVSKNMMISILFLFLFLYQIYGGYFTNPVNWILYGLILRWDTEITPQNQILLDKR